MCGILGTSLSRPPFNYNVPKTGVSADKKIYVVKRFHHEFSELGVNNHVH